MALAQGQVRFAIALGCTDSRVAAELAFDRRPGDWLVVCIAGHFVTPEGLGSLELGAAVQSIKPLLVLGHARCGGVSATVDALREGSNTPPGRVVPPVRAMTLSLEPVMAQPGRLCPQGPDRRAASRRA